MKVTKEIESAEGLRDYFRNNAWSGAKQRYEAIEERDDYMSVWGMIFDYMDACMGEFDETDLNDTLWFDEEIQKIIYSEEYEEESEEDDNEQ